MSPDGVATLALVSQLMMAVGLSACAGLRAWLPLLVVGALARGGLLPLQASFAFLASTPALLVFGLATLLELSADKVIVVDHALDAVSTLVRPVAGTLLAAASLTQVDPLMATVSGIALGGSAALTVHAGKAALRAKSSALVGVHGGLGNASLSLIEDVAATLGSALAVLVPVIGFLIALVLLGLAIFAMVLFVRAGKRLISLLRPVRSSLG